MTIGLHKYKVHFRCSSLPLQLAVTIQQLQSAGIFTADEGSGSQCHLNIGVALFPCKVQELHDAEGVKPAPESLAEGRQGGSVGADFLQGAREVVLLQEGFQLRGQFSHE